MCDRILYGMSADPCYQDHLESVHARGRGAQLNPGNRFEAIRLHILGDHLDSTAIEHPKGQQSQTRILNDRSRTIINRIDSPDLPFEWTINPYRGCEHGCVYCYARPTHETLGLSSGLDFESVIVAKENAPELLRCELSSSRWNGEPIVMSGVTDPYQPIEGTLRITRRCLEVMVECGQPVSLITKSQLITRDLDLLQPHAMRRAAKAAISITTLDPHLARAMEPRASSPAQRLRAVRSLSEAGIPVAVMVAPILPGLNDHEIPAILRAAREHGATSAGWIMLRLPHQLRAIFVDWLHRTYPNRAKRIVHHLQEMRGDSMYDATYGRRMRGRGALAEQIDQSFTIFARRYGLDQPGPTLSSDSFRRPISGGQLNLFS